MNITGSSNLRTTRVAVLAGLMCTSFGALAEMPRSEYQTEKDAIAQRYDAARDACAQRAGNAKDVCIKQAELDRTIATGELDVRDRGTADAREDAQRDRINAEFSLADEKCDDLGGNKKSVCEKEARATRDKALADLKADVARQEADTKAVKERREADYKVALQKCESLAGDAKSACKDDAKRRFGG
jgi:hypothetical protein